MRIIDSIGEVVQKHKKEFEQIELEFNKQNEKYKSFLYQDHDRIGRILKYHLITEYYINEYLKNKYPDLRFDKLELRYYQKLTFLPTNDPRIEFVRGGLIELNKIRNKFSHKIDAQVDHSNVREMLEILKVARKEKQYKDVMQVIEDFTTVACTFMIVTPKEIDRLFTSIFEKIK